MAKEIGGSRAQPGPIQPGPARPPIPASPTRLRPPQIRHMAPGIQRAKPVHPPVDRLFPPTRLAMADDSPVVQLQTSEQEPPPANVWREAVGAVLGALGSLARPSGGGVNAADVQQRMADQAGLAIPAQ